MIRAIEVTRAQNFSKWYQTVIKAADLAEPSPVRGCMVIRPWGYGIWELVQQELDRRFKETGHENCYFPLFIPLSFFAKEARHVEGFAKEMAVVTHHRLMMSDKGLTTDPDAVLHEPLVVRPTSETIVGDCFRRWIQGHRDLPILVNQWANVVRWEMRPRLFLRTTEFLWQEGHTAHADRESAFAETLQMLEVYRHFAEETMSMPVVAGEKPENERFPGAENTFSIEAMMQDGKALQAGTSHYLGTNFARAQDITYQAKNGKVEYVHTTSWGVSTRLIGGLIMTHGDDDGLRIPPALAPYQVTIVPFLKGLPDDARVIEYCNGLAARTRSISSFGRPVRTTLDTKDIRASEKRWNWIRRGVPIIVEVGIREVDQGNVSYIRRDQSREGDRLKSQTIQEQEFVANLSALLSEIQTGMLDEARAKHNSLIHVGVDDFQDLADYFGAAPEESELIDDQEPTNLRGWVRTSWSRPTGSVLAEISERLKALKLTIRNAPLNQPDVQRACIFTGMPGTQEILIGRAY